MYLKAKRLPRPELGKFAETPEALLNKKAPIVGAWARFYISINYHVDMILSRDFLGSAGGRVDTGFECESGWSGRNEASPLLVRSEF